jgi:ABC-type multidrug transport system fused ATPase/permease subunit
VFRLLVPIYFGDAVNSVESTDFSAAEHFVVLILIVSGLSAIAQFVVNYGSQYLSQRYAYGLRKDVFHHLLNKKFRYFETQTSGNLLSRSTMDIEATRNFVLNVLSQLIPTIFLIAIAFYFLITLDVIYSLFFLVVVPLLIYLGITFQRKQRNHWRKIRDTYGMMNERLQENITGQRVVRGFLGEDREIGRFTETTDTYFQEYNLVAKLRGKYNNLMPLLISAAATGVILYGGYTSLITGSQIGNLAAAVNIFNTMAFPVSFLGRLIVFSENARAGIDRIDTIIDGKDEEAVSGEIMNPLSPPAEVNAITFSRGSKVILNDMSFQIKKGEFVAITGTTGSGKSTLINMLPRLYDPDSGTISYNGVVYDKFTLPEIRERIAVVPQEISLLSGSIRENIAFGNGEFTDEEVAEAARIAHIDDFIEGLPDKYETIVGERGITLSGGQKQRVAIARAVITKPELLIFDDATSSLDSETELDIFNSIRKKLRSTSVIIISLKETGLMFADRVLVVDNGNLEEITESRRNLIDNSRRNELAGGD